MTTRLCAILLIAFVSTGCPLRPKPKFTPAPSPTPSLGPPAQRPVAAERMRDDDAMTFADLSLLLRMSTPEAEIMQHIARRGFLEPVNVNQAHSLLAINGSERLVLVVQDPQYVLTPAERQDYLARKHQRETAARGGNIANQKQREAEFAERQRQIDLQQQTFAIASQKEAEQKAREQAKLAYERRRKGLEQEIDLLQKRITDYRRSGYNENDLTGMHQRLKTLRDELHNLKSP